MRVLLAVLACQVLVVGPLAAAEPVAAEPVATEPVATEPVATEPVATEPVDAEPVAAEPADDGPADDGPVDYGKQIKPLLAEHCWACHGPDEQESGLRLDTAAAAITGGDSGAAIVAGKSGESLLIAAVTGSGDVTKMPQDADPLSDEQIALLRSWIDQGAHAPDDEKPVASTSRGEDHWSFQPVKRPVPPAVKNIFWVNNGIDRFILSRLETEGLAPSPEAARATLLRRVSLDLLGLLPTTSEVDEFLNDTRADAYERLVDRLLASPHYGERWGRHWLDAARYADSDGYTIDGPRTIWKYRDWVIDALNRDLPFDRFTLEQLAGDLLPDAREDQIIATGFHRNTMINNEGGTDDEQFRVEAVADRVSTTATVFLGLTIGCARCHDHKFDPISQRGYYQLFAFFDNSDEPTIEVPTPEQAEQRRKIREQIKRLSGELAEHDKEQLNQMPDWLAALAVAKEPTLPVDVVAFLDIPERLRTKEQQAAVVAEFRKTDEARGHWVTRIDSLKKSEPKIPKTMVIRARAELRQTHVMKRGDFLRPGIEVQPDVPAVLPALTAESDRPTRIDLARWIVDRSNPLTARVTVNRIWQRYFGQGIVATENDFGTQGSLPTHPRLLDYLASRFMDSGWKLKDLHRLIVTSATYRQASHTRADLAAADPYNLLLARQSRLRLDAEVIRDVALDAAGLLSNRIGGASVHPHQPGGVMQLAQVKRDWIISPGENRYRRGMYTYFWRSTPYPFLKLFDAPDATRACTRRTRSNTPLQALTLLNDAAFIECARTLAVRILADPLPDDNSRLRHAFRICLSREPDERERRRLAELLEQQLAALPGDIASSEGAGQQTADQPTAGQQVADKEAAEQPAVEGQALEGQAESTDQAQLIAWTVIARVLLNLDEFITRE